MGFTRSVLLLLVFAGYALQAQEIRYIAIAALIALGQDHPAKPPFTIAASPETQTVKTASSIWVKVTLTNTSNHGLDTSANISDLTGIDPNFIFDVRDTTGNLVSKRVYKHPEPATGHAILGRIIKPGESLTEEADVSRLYDMTRSGAYVIQVSRYISETQKDGVVKSNKIRVDVIP